ncbi:Uncharacterised protein [Mycobacteroides abscessus subsp. abscessus]|nr:Uncharacterised protein [Mycobacteroides abscessus subsp. abscessus]
MTAVVDHRGERRRGDLGRGEGAVGDVGEDAEGGLVADDGDLVVREDVAQVLGGAHTLVGAVVDDAGDLVVELGGDEVEGVLHGTGDRVVVLGSDEDEGVELVELRTPGLGVGVLVALRTGRDDLIEEREVEGAEVDDLGGHVVATGELVADPLDDLRVEGSGTGGSGDDGDCEHGRPSLSGRWCAAEPNRPGGGPMVGPRSIGVPHSGGTSMPNVVEICIIPRPGCEPRHCAVGDGVRVRRSAVGCGVELGAGCGRERVAPDAADCPGTTAAGGSICGIVEGHMKDCSIVDD